MIVLYVLYSLISLILLLVSIRQARSKFAVGLVGFWLLSQPILYRPEFMISTPLGFDLQPTRLVFLLIMALFVYHARDLFRGFFNRAGQLLFFEKMLICFLLVAIMSLAISSLSVRIILVQATNLLAFPSFYLLAKRYITGHQDTYILFKIFIYFSLLSVAAALVQFFFNPEFFRVSSQRLAYGEIYRANGFFPGEYEQGIFLSCMAAVAFYSVRNWFLRVFLLTTFTLGVFVTMHRGSWIIFAVVIIYLSILASSDLKKSQKRVVFLFSIFGVAFMLLAAAFMHKSPIDISSDFVQDRFLTDTFSIRFNLLDFGMYVIRHNPLGVGDYQAEEYWQLYYQYGLRYHMGAPLVIHNGYLAAAAKYGIIGGAFFMLFLMGSLRYYWRRGAWKLSWSAVQFASWVAFALMNMSQEYSMLGIPSVIFLALLAGLFPEMPKKTYMLRVGTNA